MADVPATRRVWAGQLLEMPSGHPYAKWAGAHWRLVELADLGIDVSPARVRPHLDRVLDWLAQPQSTRALPPGADGTRPRRHASQEGNALYAGVRLGFAGHPRVAALADVLLATQWPDGGWNCDRHQDAWRSSFHETVTPAIGLAVFAQTSGRTDAAAAARRAAELLLDHRLFRRGGTGPAVHPSWVELHYPPYWHYDLLQGLRLLQTLGLLEDERAGDALDVLAGLRRDDDGWPSRSWASSVQPAAVDYGKGTRNAMLNERARHVLAAAG